MNSVTFQSLLYLFLGEVLLLLVASPEHCIISWRIHRKQVHSVLNGRIFCTGSTTEMLAISVCFLLFLAPWKNRWGRARGRPPSPKKVLVVVTIDIASLIAHLRAGHFRAQFTLCSMVHWDGRAMKFLKVATLWYFSLARALFPHVEHQLRNLHAAASSERLADLLWLDSACRVGTCSSNHSRL